MSASWLLDIPDLFVIIGGGVRAHDHGTL